MHNILLGFDPLWQSFVLSTFFSYGFTAFGAAMVFFIKRPSDALFSFMMSFAAGVMMAAAIFPLLVPAFEYFSHYEGRAWVTWLTLSFTSGALVFYIFDVSWHIIEQSRAGIKINLGNRTQSKQNRGPVRRAWLLAGAITLHNIPEGMAVGVATAEELKSGFIVALGIGLHDFAEGMAVSVPLLASGMNPWLAFFLGQASGVVSPIASVLSTQFALSNLFIMPHMLAFAAGCMIFVVAEDLMPNAYEKQNKLSASIPFFVGFVLMMWLDQFLS